jgi:hypothetical protein
VAQKGDRDAGRGGGLAPHRTEGGGRDDEGWAGRAGGSRRRLCGAGVERVVQEGEGHPSLAESDGVGEERPAVEVERTAEASDRDALVRAERDRADAGRDRSGAGEVEGGRREGGA